jgi:hypothetical protein
MVIQFICFQLLTFTQQNKDQETEVKRLFHGCPMLQRDQQELKKLSRTPFENP